MNNVIHMSTYREGRTARQDKGDMHPPSEDAGGDKSKLVLAPEGDTILIHWVTNDDYAYSLNGIFRTSRRLTAQVITKVLGEVLEG